MAQAPQNLPPEVLAAFERNQPIEALKLLMRAGVGATAARSAEAEEAAVPSIGGRRLRGRKAAAAPRPDTTAELPPSLLAEDGLSPGEVPRSAPGLWGWVLLALVAYLAWRLLR